MPKWYKEHGKSIFTNSSFNFNIFLEAIQDFTLILSLFALRKYNSLLYLFVSKPKIGICIFEDGKAVNCIMEILS